MYLFNVHNLNQKTINRFFKLINLPKNIIDECWIWTGCKNLKGYGSFWFCNKRREAHRFSYYFYNDNFKLEDSTSIYVCHKCDNPSCVNPNHLFLGSHQDNMFDMKNKHRSISGEKSHFTKYSKEELKIVIDKIINHEITNRQELREATTISEKLILDILQNKYRYDVYSEYSDLSQYLYLFKTHLTDELIKIIQIKLSQGLTAYKIAKNMKLPYSTVNKIKNNKTYNK